ncbi:MAG: pyruvate kinase [Actinomycetota bacterium]
MTRRVKLVCTVGPATGSRERVRELLDAGTDVARVNFSHGTPEDHARAVALVREAERTCGRDVAVMADLPGPKIRLGELPSEGLRLRPGDRFSLSAESSRKAPSATVSYAGLSNDLRSGDRVLLSDGAVELVVRGLDGSDVVTEVVRGGTLRSGAGVNVPAERLGLPAITPRDREGLSRALELGVDLIAQSFVRGAADVIGLRALMGERQVPIVAKIETRPAAEDVGAILEEADALMVARGDLGVELPMEEIPVLQKEMLRAARTVGKPAIVATQMLESMIHAPRPTRAEASDAANAVLDGADAIMLSGETAIGEYPIEAARAAARIAEVAEERAGDFRRIAEPKRHTDEAAAVAHAAAQVAAGDPAVVAIACFTRTGRTAALLSAERPDAPIYAFIADAGIRRAMALRWGVHSLPAGDPSDTDAMIALMDRGVRDAGLADEGNSVVMVASSPAGKVHTNMLKVHQVGEAAG